jgi:L-alanine-DL-glutamate epimerase-like enolase superfamily enzyme
MQDFLRLMTEGNLYYLQPNAARVGGVTACGKTRRSPKPTPPVSCHCFSSVYCLCTNMQVLARCTRAPLSNTT